MRCPSIARATRSPRRSPRSELAVGVAFGAAGIDASAATFAAALELRLGSPLPNFPEGAVSLPLRREGSSPPRSFFYGQISAVVEPVAARRDGTAHRLTVMMTLDVALG